MGHSCGGASISYAMECYPRKISKAVFVSATMVSDGQRPYDVFAEEVCHIYVCFFFLIKNINFVGTQTDEDAKHH